ncbi:uncharacterized protein LOC125225528 [Leguminivora glycinivorella]|uniref:uncharacterized protein LOC125225528 n=1 Tax=Leguminivora glycinivorella TaxID=1035111 RepID=UPI00200C3AFA|nr:uncharacterized protein LOC125225528 [Leguminivora glycinivorella]
MQCLPGTCPAMNVKCYVCQNYGHYARRCNAPRSIKKVYGIEVREEDSDGGEDDYQNLADCDDEGDVEQVLSPAMDPFSSAESSEETVVESHSPMITIRKRGGQIAE